MKKKIIKALLLIIIMTLTITILYATKVEAINKVKLGDINQDNKVDARDQLLIMRHIMASARNTHPEWILTGDNLKIADVTQNGKVDNSDMLKILRYIAAERNPEKIGKQHPDWLVLKEIELYNNQSDTTGIKLNKTNVTTSDDDSTYLFATALPNNTTEQNVEWINDNHELIAMYNIIENGTYYIETNLDKKKVLGIKNNSKDNEAKVELQNKENNNSQKLEIINAEDGYYIIRVKNSEKVLDVSHTGKDWGTKVIQYDYSGNDNQLWKFEDAGNGNYYIKSKCNDLYLDIKDGNAVNGLELQVWPGNYSNAQSFKLEQIEKAKKEIEDGTYTIKTIINENKVFEVTDGSKENQTEIQLQEKSAETVEKQQFELLGIGNGYYIIRAKNSGKVLDVSHASKEWGTKVIQYTFNGNDNQLWRIESAGNGQYFIKSKCNGLYLDIKDGNAIDGLKLQVWPGNKSIAQKFKLDKINSKIKYDRYAVTTITSKGTGTTTITAKTTNGKTAKCTVTARINTKSISLLKPNISLYNSNSDYVYATVHPYNATNQNVEWHNSNTNVVEMEKIIDNGIYYIKTNLNENRVLGIKNRSNNNEAKVELQDKETNNNSQKLELERTGDGYYIIRSKSSGKVLDVSHASKEWGTKVIQYDYSGNDNQKWKIEYAGDGNYYIKSKCNDLYLDIKDGNAVNGLELQVWPGNYSNAQTFKLELIEKAKKEIEDGTYTIKTALNEKKVLEIKDDSRENQAIVQLQEKSKQAEEKQQFEIVDLGIGHYIIRSKSSGKVLDVTQASKEWGTKVIQYTFNGNDNQLWKLENAGNGYYYIKSKCNDLYLDIKNGITANGQQLQVWPENNSNAQKFKLDKIDSKIRYAKYSTLIVKSKQLGTSTITAKTYNGLQTSCKVYNTRFSGDYIEQMKQKIIYYGSITDYGCVVDADLCRLTIFKKNNQDWDIIRECNTIQGARRNKFANEFTWTGPRSRSFKGAYRIHGKIRSGYISCYLYFKHGGATDKCQRFEVSNWGDPYKLELKDRFESHGCTNLSLEDAKFIYDNIPIGTTVIVFDKLNPLPYWDEGDSNPVERNK